jgi:hypothetical protein
MQSSAIWRHIGLVRTSVLEERVSASGSFYPKVEGDASSHKTHTASHPRRRHFSKYEIPLLSCNCCCKPNATNKYITSNSINVAIHATHCNSGMSGEQS